jgi:mitogen-activated protein kinase kinase kinase
MFVVLKLLNSSALTNRLIAKVQKSFLQHVRSPPSTRFIDPAHVKGGERHRTQQQAPVTHEDTIRWFTQVLDGVRLRHRKLQRYSR